MSTLSLLRTGRITGSRIAGVLGISPYDTRSSVLRAMVRQHFGAEDEFTGNIATDWGTEHEPDAIEAYERREGILIHSSQEIIVHPDLPLAATPDGLIDELGVLEVKCPWRGSYVHIDERPDYQAQCQLIMFLTGREWTDFGVWRAHTGVIVSRLLADPQWILDVLPAIEQFMAEYETITASEELAAPYLSPLVDQRTDPEWAEAALAHIEAKLTVERAQAELDQAKALLVGLAAGKPTRGCGVSIHYRQNKGPIAYSRIVKDHLSALDLTPYRGAPALTPVVRTDSEGDN
jgi:putative phage-type endonuclease